MSKIDEDDCPDSGGSDSGKSDAGISDPYVSDRYVSTGRLPPHDRVVELVQKAYADFLETNDGDVSSVYPALARMPGERFGISVVATTGEVYSVGDAEVPFTLMSVSKPFLFALMCNLHGPAVLREKVGVNPTGLPFNSLEAIERGDHGTTNPMVNAGAIATTSLVPGASRDEKWAFIESGFSAFAGRPLAIDEEVYASARETNFRNQSIARLLQSYGRIDCDPAEAVDLYTKQCCLQVTCQDLAVMGSTLADGGVNPITRTRVVEPIVCHYALAVMATAGLYETSGDWLYEIGLPGKSGISGGIVTVSPGKGGLGTFSPRLDAAGNSVRGQRVAAQLSQTLGLDLFLSHDGDDRS